jgi:hypothetical protein
MRAENWAKNEVEIEGWPVTITCYEIGDSCITEIAAAASGASIARGIAETREASREAAMQAAARRLLRTRRINLTVGG